MDITRLDHDSYNIIWENLIYKEIHNYMKQYTNCIDILPYAKDLIWEKYTALNTYCRNVYMYAPDNVLDRHKVAACYMMAIVMVRPMIFTGGMDQRRLPLAVNEMLAITVGFSLVRAFIIEAAKENKHLSEAEKTKINKQFKDGLNYPSNEFIYRGDYISNYANELRFGVEDGKIGVLSIAHELFLLEVITRMKKI